MYPTAPLENANLLYLTNGVCENAHGDERYFRQLDIPFGAWNPSTGEVEAAPNGILPDETEFYPLTNREAAYVTCADGFLTSEGEGLMGYSVLFKGRKYLAPSVEIVWDCVCPDESIDREDALEKARAMARKIHAPLFSIGGTAVVQVDDAGDRHTVIALIPFDFVLGKPFESYLTFLKELFA